MGIYTLNCETHNRLCITDKKMAVSLHLSHPEILGISLGFRSLLHT